MTENLASLALNLGKLFVIVATGLLLELQETSRAPPQHVLERGLKRKSKRDANFRQRIVNRTINKNSVLAHQNCFSPFEMCDSFPKCCTRFIFKGVIYFHSSAMSSII